MTEFVLALSQIDRNHAASVGAKAAHLGALRRLEGVQVPDGFCVTTHAFETLVATRPDFDALHTRLTRVKGDDQASIHTLSAELRALIREVALPDALKTAIAREHTRIGEAAAYAVRSSASAEDLPTASFAGQQETTLNVVGREAILRHIVGCWASLFTERAVTYRLRSGLAGADVRMAVLIQEMVLAEAAGVLFTADPVSGNRKISAVEASFGLGEALVSGLVDPDAFKVRDGVIVSRVLGQKRLAVVPSPAGGTHHEAVAPARQTTPSLSDAQVLRLAALGRRIEAHLGAPQDLEWCLAGDVFHVLQSRPITTLFPIPEPQDGTNRVYVSVGHQQMMTDPMRPLGLSLWQMKARFPMREAGGRLFVDVTAALASPTGRVGLMNLLGRSDPLIGDALQTLADRPDFLPAAPSPGSASVGPPAGAAPTQVEADPALVEALVARGQAGIAAARHAVQDRSGLALLEAIALDHQELKRYLFDATSMQVIMGAIEAARWLDEHLATWLGVTHAADVLSQSVPGNVTSEMGLALLDVADVLRRHPAVVSHLEAVTDDAFMDTLPALPGGHEVHAALRHWLDTYGVRGVGEIDITRPRFYERPTMLLPLLLGHVRNFAPGEATRRFEAGRGRAAELETSILERLTAQAPHTEDGERRVEDTRRMILRLRTFAGYREYPKFVWVSHDAVYKRALREEGRRLVAAGALRDAEDLDFLRFEELHTLVSTGAIDPRLIAERTEAFASYRALRPPRVLTSDGEAVTGAYRREHLPSGALVGLPVCAGVVEGRARVITDVADADLEPGDILVTTYTDPSWTPLFVAIRALVTEVGGLMTHGAVVAREYGLPTVVGVVNATSLIKDGQRVRVDGTHGYVELLDPEAPPVGPPSP